MHSNTKGVPSLTDILNLPYPTTVLCSLSVILNFLGMRVLELHAELEEMLMAILIRVPRS